jgi:leader peptidase (prepilin peptidase)/N-methyltransferase
MIHLTVTRLPDYLHHTWTLECYAFLKKMPSNTSKLPHKKHSWRHYLPFFSLGFLTLDIVLLTSSCIVFYHFADPTTCVSALIFTWLLITSSFIDFEHHILPDEMTYSLLWLGLFFSCWPLYINPNMAILSTLIAYCSLFSLATLFKIIRKKDGLGQGDVKLFAALAAWTGMLSLPLLLLIASLSSLIFIVTRKIICGKNCSSPAAFGPFLAFAAWLILLWGSNIRSFLLG